MRSAAVAESRHQPFDQLNFLSNFDGIRRLDVPKCCRVPWRRSKLVPGCARLYPRAVEVSEDSRIHLHSIPKVL